MTEDYGTTSQLIHMETTQVRTRSTRPLPARWGWGRWRSAAPAGRATCDTSPPVPRGLRVRGARGDCSKQHDTARARHGRASVERHIPGSRLSQYRSRCLPRLLCSCIGRTLNDGALRTMRRNMYNNTEVGRSGHYVRPTSVPDAHASLLRALQQCSWGSASVLWIERLSH